MPSITPDTQKVRGVKMYLGRTRTDEQLLELSDVVFNSGSSEEVTITSTSAEGGSATGEVTFPKWLLQLAVEELLTERGLGSVSTRNICTKPDWRGAWSTT